MNKLINWTSDYADELIIGVMLLLAFAGFYWLCWRTLKADRRRKRRLK